ARTDPPTPARPARLGPPASPGFSFRGRIWHHREVASRPPDGWDAATSRPKKASDVRGTGPVLGSCPDVTAEGSRFEMNTLQTLDAESLRSDVPEFRAGDTLKVHVRVIEGSRSRIQVFQGVAIRRQGGGLQETFTVRKVSFGVGVERTFPVHTPVIDKIEVVTRGDVRRAKLYYLRDLRGKAAKIKEKRDNVAR